MDISIIKILSLFGGYFLVGCVPLLWVRISTSRLERAFAGTALIIYASFLLAAIALTSNLFESLMQAPESSEYAREQTKSIIPIIVFLGSVFTFLFGGVGTNVVASALSQDANNEVLEAIKNLDNKVHKLTSNEPSLKMHYWWLGVNTFILAIGFLVILGLLKN